MRSVRRRIRSARHGFPRADARHLHRRMSRWLAEGRTLGASLRRFTCIVVAGPDSEATAEVALGVAEAQAPDRRVVLGDLLDDAPRYAAFRTADDDHHGLVDALHYGTSLARITRSIE